ncbi:class I adenylate-forming enzyme family protein [Rodentibacter sp. Ppn85]|uniref:AMP-binding protein n=1 Tax=Rodentibacter sp. Ppn85 TaxID=1908525 RepID=UPI000987A250|nr:class I adenylate-forming enzyme family protein [Rodentibacter sp. Ppn85]OOF65650.1 AMP-binding protein [Rodentibacter sp. Ppn85]
MKNNFTSNTLIALNPEWKWQDFAERSQQITAQLKQDDVHSVAFWFDDAASFACTMLACFNANVRILLPPNLLPENQQWIARHSDFLFDDKRFESYGILQKVSENRPLFDAENQTEIWLKTSGSSGEPKVLCKTAQQMWIESQAIVSSIPFNTADFHVVSSVSAQHHYGLSYRIMLPLAMGWTIGRQQLPYPEYMIAESLHAKKCLWISSPALLSHLNMADSRFADFNLGGIISSGGVLPVHVGNALREKLNTTVVECYGSTETGAIAFRAGDGLWSPTPLTQVGLNEQGALWVDSQWLNQREQTADAAEFYGEKFKLLGRIDRIIKFGDKRISLVSIEQHLLQQSLVADCYIAQHPEKARPAAWVALTEEGIRAYHQQGRGALIEQLRHFLMQSQEVAAIPRFWRFTQQLPRNSQSKISRLDFNRVFLTQQDDNL